MSSDGEPSEKEVEELCSELRKGAEEGGYFLNPDERFVRDLARGLLINAKRYGYPSCPCRIATGRRSEDIDIECPCEYRDDDIREYGACYCALYVSEEIATGKKQVEPVPERRLPPAERERARLKGNLIEALPYPVWRCRVCGYLCARAQPPERCPVCRAKGDRFERFL